MPSACPRLPLPATAVGCRVQGRCRGKGAGGPVSLTVSISGGKEETGCHSSLCKIVIFLLQDVWSLKVTVRV